MTFKDAAGREWLVRVDCNALRRIRDGLGVSFGDWKEIGELLKRLLFDDLFVCEVAYLIIKPEADKRTIGEEGFFAEMHGDAIASASEAVERGLVDFFRDPAIRAGVKAEIEAVKAMTTAALAIPTDSGPQSTSSPEDSESIPDPSLSAS